MKSNLEMVVNGRNHVITASSRQHFEQHLGDGLRNISALMMHRLELDRMLSPEEWRSIIDAHNALRHIQLREFK